MPRFPLLVSALALTLVAPFASADPAGTDTTLQAHSLANGFHYAVLARTNEPGRISLRLIVHAGSLDEHDDERGFAHFVEHMAFNGTKHYPPGKLVLFFQKLGLAWGADANAETSFTWTTYKLDLPPGKVSHLDEALQILRDYADGITFDSAEVRRERAVVLSEIAMRDNDEWQTRKKNISAYYNGTSLPDRLPIGDLDLIRHAEAMGLRHFYERCYRPERMTLVIVGDVANEPLQTLLEKNFASLRGRGPAVAQILPKAPAVSHLEANLITSPLGTAASVTLTSIVPVGDSPAALEDTLGASAAFTILDRRLTSRRATVADRIGLANAFLVQGLDNRYIHYGLGATAAFADWPAALGIIETELRRARENGFTDAEVQETVAATLANFRADLAGFPGRPAIELANNVASILAAGREWHSPASTLALAENYFAHFTPATALDRLRAVIPDDRLHITLLTRIAPERGSEAVLAAYRKSATQPLAIETAKSGELRFPYDDFGPSGTVAERRTDTSLGLELVRFANGARLNLRANPSEPQRFRLWARLGRGTADVPREQPGINLLAIAWLSRSDLGRLKREDLHRLTELHAIDGNWNFDGNDFVIQLTGPVGELPFAFRSLTAYLSDVKLDPDRRSETISTFVSLVSSLLNSTAADAKPETMFRATGEDSRFFIPSRAEIEKYSFDTVAAWMRAHWLDGPLEIGLAGDFKTDDAIATAAASIGALAPRREWPPLASERIAFRAKPYRNLSIVDLPDKTADIRIFWPMRDAADLRAVRATRIGAAALEDRLRVKLRQELGVTYAPSGSVYRDPSQPDFGLAFVELTFAPANALKLTERTIKLAGDFAREGLTKDEFERVREPLRAVALAELRSNEWWLANVLTRAQTQPAALEEAHTHATAFADLTRDDVNRAVAAHFRATESNAIGFIPGTESTARKP